MIQHFSLPCVFLIICLFLGGIFLYFKMMLWQGQVIMIQAQRMSLTLGGNLIKQRNRLFPYIYFICLVLLHSLPVLFPSWLQALLRMHLYILHLSLVQGKGRNTRMNLPYEVTQQLLFWKHCTFSDTVNTELKSEWVGSEKFFSHLGK